MELHKIVKKLEKKMWKIITIEDIGDILDPGQKGVVREDARIHQTVYALKGQGTIISIRNGLYYVADGLCETGEQVVEKYYWDIVKYLLLKEAGKEWMIGGEKSLELAMMDYSLPESLIIYTKDINKKVVLSPKHEILFRTMATGEKHGRTNAFTILKKQSQNILLKKENFTTLGLEASLLDTLTIHDHEEGIGEALVLKFLKRYEGKLERGNFGILVAIRYIRAMNRLREIAKNHGYERLYEISLDVIKKEGGGCFVSF